VRYGDGNDGKAHGSANIRAAAGLYFFAEQRSDTNSNAKRGRMAADSENEFPST
jgi:hypothetical protein